MIPIWKKYFLKEWAKVFILFIVSFYFLYVLIDFSAHIKAFNQDSVHFGNIALYYACQFSQRADILVCFALLIATIKVLTTFNVRSEIVAFVSCGIPLKKLLGPFFFAAFLCSTFLYTNFQFLQPISIQHLKNFEENFFREKNQEERFAKVHYLSLKDGSTLIYRSFNPILERFSDVYWIRSANDVYRIKTLRPYEKIPLGEYVDHLVRNSKGDIIRERNSEAFYFTEMKFDIDSLYKASHPPRWQSLSQLALMIPWKEVGGGFIKMNDREAQSVSCFYRKMLSPLVCFLAVIAPAPFCMRFGRFLPLFMIYSLSLFGMITFFTLVNSSAILGESQVIPPAVAAILPFLAFFLFFGRRYAKL